MANQFGFPTWTLWGMGLAAFGALVAVSLAFLAQSPRLLSRLNLTGRRLDLRARAYTGYGLALLLLSIGFFVAGVPLGPGGEATAGDTTTAAALSADDPLVAGTLDPAAEAGDETTGGQSGAMVGLPTSAGGASGAMTGLITPQVTLEPGAVISDTGEIALPPGATTGEPAATAAPGETPQPTPTRTLVPTPTPTATPSPTPTPTPILVPTARVNDGTSTLPVRRLPCGVVLIVLVRGDTVIPLPGHAFYDGDPWREIPTVDGVIGWVPDEFLDYEEAAQ